MIFRENSVIQEIVFDGYHISVKRDDLIDPLVSGNKLFKLKHNVEEAQRLGLDGILTFGGAFSNHIAATAKLTSLSRLRSIGIIRGERIEPLNSTLTTAEASGMQLRFISRQTYRDKNDSNYLAELKNLYPGYLIVPEGGANLLGIKGAGAILNSGTTSFDLIISAVGTATTIAGLVKSKQAHQQIVGYPVHKHAAVFEDAIAIDRSLGQLPPQSLEIRPQYHFGGYVKWNQDLIQFIRQFKQQTGIALDPIYTGKAMYGLIHDLKNEAIDPNKSILFIHTGGVQGNAGFENRFGIELFPD